MNLFIIIPVYNAEKYLTDAINSVLREVKSARFNIEILLINDGSTDNSNEICARYHNEYPNIIKYFSRENQGVSIARNIGLQYIYDNYTKNDSWIAFLDSDDWFCAGWADVIYKHAYKSTSDIIGFGMKIYDNRKWVRDIIQTEKILVGNYDTAIAENNKQSFATYIYKAQFLRKSNIFFPPKVRNGEDLMFKYAAMISANELRYTNSYLYANRQNSDSVTANYSNIALEHYKDFFLAWNGLIKWAEENASSDEYSKLINFAKFKINCSCLYMARSYCSWFNGNYKSFKRDIINGAFKTNFLHDILFPKNTDLLVDFKLLTKKPFWFFMKFRSKGIIYNIKSIIKAIIGRK